MNNRTQNNLPSPDALQRLSQWEDPHFAVIDRMRDAFKDVPPEEIEREAVGGRGAGAPTPAHG